MNNRKELNMNNRKDKTMGNRKQVGTGITGAPIYGSAGRGAAAMNRWLSTLDTTTEERVAYHTDRLSTVEWQVEQQRVLVDTIKGRLHFKWQLAAAEKTLAAWQAKAIEARADLARVLGNTEEVILDNNTGRK